MTLRSSRTSLYVRRIGYSGTAFRATGLTFKFFALSLNVAVFFFLSFSDDDTFDHRLNENRKLWKLSTLPPGFISFYSTTKPLDKSWHVLGLGYLPSISMDDINNAAEVQFNMNMKLWLDIAMNQFQPLWSRYVDKENEYVQAYIFNFGDD